MMGGAKAHYDGIVAFSQTDFTDDLKKISVPTLVMHGDDDQIVPYADSGPLTAKLVKNATLKTYRGFPHGMPTTHAPRSTRIYSNSFVPKPKVSAMVIIAAAISPHPSSMDGFQFASRLPECSGRDRFALLSQSSVKLVTPMRVGAKAHCRSAPHE